MNLETVITEVIAEGRRLRAVPDQTRRQGFKHRDVSINSPRAVSRWKKLRSAILNVHRNPHDLLHLVFKIPYVGYATQLFLCIMRLPRQLAKIREELASIHRNLSAMESRVIESNCMDVDELSKRLKLIEQKLNTPSLKDSH